VRPFTDLALRLCLLALALAACGEAPSPPPLNTPAVDIVTAAPVRATPTLFPSLTPPPLVNVTPTITATPAPVLRQLLSGGCCVQPAWSPDGRELWYLDRPDATQAGGLWAVGVEGGAPRFLTARIGAFSQDGALMAYLESGQTFVERVATGERWRVPADGRAIAFSPDGAHIAWQSASSSAHFDRRLVEVWVADVQGDNARVVARNVGGGLAAWLSDSARLLLTGREADATEPFLGTVNITDGTFTGLVRGDNLRGAVPSPGGGWVAFQVAFAADPARDGLWVVSADGAQARKLPVFGAYRWRSEGQLLVVPLEATGGSHRLVEVEAATGAVRDLTNPAVTAFRIAAGDWALAPDGRRVAFVNAADRNLWLLELPDP
jgi:hypothetical protein